MSQREQPFVPKVGTALRVVGICRISATHQDPRTLEDQEAYDRRWLRRHMNVPWVLGVIAGHHRDANAS
jgi:hypothetical protein